jgi:nicotinate phosphoribosyltransferase
VAHSVVQAFDSEADAFRAFARLNPETILLVDTYDTADGVRRVVALARELGDAFRIRGVRLDSGDLLALSREARAILDPAGLRHVQVFASGGLDEAKIAGLLDAGAPIDAFGVGTAMSVSDDVPALDLAYKLTSYAGLGWTKFSAGKRILPGRKQVFRRMEDGLAAGDVIACAEENLSGRPLLQTMMRAGRRLQERPSLSDTRNLAATELAALPARLHVLHPADPPYAVTISAALAAEERAVHARIISPQH